MQFKRNEHIHTATPLLANALRSITTVSSLCSLINNKKFRDKLNEQDKGFLGVITQYFKELDMIYKHHHKYLVKGVNENIQVFFQRSKKLTPHQLSNLKSQPIPSYSQYVPLYHEDYVYSDENWDPSLAHL